MKPKPTPHSRYHIHDLVRLLRYLPPVLSGSTVAVLDVRQVGHGALRYQVQSAEYPASPVWANEDDIAYPMEMDHGLFAEVQP
jgi:hypothetical protein